MERQHNAYIICTMIVLLLPGLMFLCPHDVDFWVDHLTAERRIEIDGPMYIVDISKSHMWIYYDSPTKIDWNSPEWETLIDSEPAAIYVGRHPNDPYTMENFRAK